MRFRKGARLDASQVSDRRGLGGPVALGGGGLIGIIVLLVSLLSGGGGGGGGQIPGLDLGGSGRSATSGGSGDLASQCRTGEDANQRDDCRIVGVVNSVQAFWREELDGYRDATTVFFEQSVDTGCGGASSAVGPFYCPGDQRIYIDLGFYEQLRTRFGARGGPFAEAYVIAHEYGHHIEKLLGVLRRASGGTGPQSDGVRVELMADCLAGLWARGAVDTGFIEELADEDIADGLDAAAAIGDDRIQEKLRGQVNPESWTHGSAEQRQRWFLTGYRQGTRAACDTFAARTV
ncbi:MAG: KPN_02809 family neutral zinc metallopeptidase [Acidimicrobiales bacterium]